MGLSSKQACGVGLDWSQQIGGGGLEIPRSEQPRLRCPRCDSTNTKFCYYNNYSRSQPRHFCKACRRYWTEGGTLRNVPVGGARKNKRPKTTTTAADADCGGSSSSTVHQAVAPLSNGGDVDHVFYQLLLSSDQGDDSLPSPLPLLPPEFVATRSASSPSPASTTTSTWLQDPPPLPASYCWNWWDDATLFAAPGLEHAATADDLLYP